MAGRSIGFLNGVLHRGAHRYFERELSQLGLHRGMIHILRELEHRDGISQQELCESMAVDKANVARVLARMEKAGLVTRSPGADDARVRRIQLTASGKGVLEPLDRILRRWNSILTSGFTPGEMEVFRSLLERSISGMTDYFQGLEHGE